MRAMIDRLDYGNREIGAVVDRFWLDGPLAISALEQARFVARLARGDLPVSARSQFIVRDILRLEQAGDAVLYGKTGWLAGTEPSIGWWTGWVDRDGKIYAFALNIDMPSVEDAPKRIAIGRSLLARLGVL
jgi:beta-lactamase class D